MIKGDFIEEYRLVSILACFSTGNGCPRGAGDGMKRAFSGCLPVIKMSAAEVAVRTKKPTGKADKLAHLLLRSSLSL